MVKQAAARTVDLDPIDRLEDKVRLLVDLVTELRAEQSRAAEENTRLRTEVGMLRSKMVDVEGTVLDIALELLGVRLADTKALPALATPA